MKKLLIYTFALFAVAFLLNWAVRLLLEVWVPLLVGCGIFAISYTTYQIIKKKNEWR
ncbi:hypothetical protein SGODD07_02018 [Streptococcus gordonii]|uniref:Uncharacterized protein n=1 Tax=Streptococcus gordonii TaxID=1302 RepID=A0A139MYH2_STRGN|nr:hypothetical protein SGODD07_02018 [Streptococcus gordonii]